MSAANELGESRTQVVHLLTGFSATDLGESVWNVAAYFERDDAEQHLRALAKVCQGFDTEDLFADDSAKLAQLILDSGLDERVDVGTYLRYEIVELPVHEKGPEPFTVAAVGPRSRPSALTRAEAMAGEER